MLETTTITSQLQEQYNGAIRFSVPHSPLLDPNYFVCAPSLSLLPISHL